MKKLERFKLNAVKVMSNADMKNIVGGYNEEEYSKDDCVGKSQDECSGDCYVASGSLGTCTWNEMIGTNLKICGCYADGTL